MVRAVVAVLDRSEPPNGPILGESAQKGSPSPRSLPSRAHHLASAYKKTLKGSTDILRGTYWGGKEMLLIWCFGPS
jgi:hypothetical protein